MKIFLHLFAGLQFAWEKGVLAFVKFSTEVCDLKIGQPEPPAWQKSTVSWDLINLDFMKDMGSPILPSHKHHMFSFTDTLFFWTFVSPIFLEKPQFPHFCYYASNTLNILRQIWN